jgi:competence protein ComEA
VPKREAEWPAEKVNINEASESELARLPGIGPNMAQRICAHRRAHGRFTSVDALKQVKGIGPEKFSDISSHVTVTSP